MRSKIIMIRTSNKIAELHMLHLIANRKRILHLILNWREQIFNWTVFVEINKAQVYLDVMIRQTTKIAPVTSP